MFSRARDYLPDSVKRYARVAVSRAKEQLNGYLKRAELRPQRRRMLSTNSSAREGTVLIVNHAKERCGINQYGLNVYNALAPSSRYAIAYAECETESELLDALVAFNPSVILYNYYPATMPWLSRTVTRKLVPVQLGMMHEVTQEDADAASAEMFDFHICPDPTLVERNPLAIKVPRIVPSYSGRVSPPERPRIGSFGFGFHDKGFVKLIETVQSEFDEADIEILMPFNDVVDVAGRTHALETAQRCRAAVTKPGIRLNISHDFLSREQLLNFLAGNTLNAFFYDVHKRRGISSTIEHALAVDRPLAITRCGMFRHVSSASPSICIEDSSLKEIIRNGTKPLAGFREDWTQARFLSSLERVFDRTLEKRRDVDAGEKRFNRILDNRARLELFERIGELFAAAPAIMTRKIQEANVQQAFVADAVLQFAGDMKSPKLLCVGSHEDTATDLLRRHGLCPEEIDPTINYDLNAFFHLPTTKPESYDIVYSTSVIEHVPDDDLFMEQICKLLKKDGVGVLTCDFNDSWRPGMPKPAVDQRLYTLNDLDIRFRRILERNGCDFVDEPQWKTGKPDFRYMGVYLYTFAAIVFRKTRAIAG